MKIRVEAAPAMVPCPTCKGKGKQTLETTTISPGKPVEKLSMEITCVVCKGAKLITPQAQRALKREMDLWCSCKTPSEDVIFHDDGECRQCRKHHYHCGTCGKITQVG